MGYVKDFLYGLTAGIHEFQGYAPPVFSSAASTFAKRPIRELDRICLYAKIVSVAIAAIAITAVTCGASAGVVVSLSSASILTWITAADLYSIANQQLYLVELPIEEFKKEMGFKTETGSDLTKQRCFEVLVKKTYLKFLWIHVISLQEQRSRFSDWYRKENFR